MFSLKHIVPLFLIYVCITVGPTAADSSLQFDQTTLLNQIIKINSNSNDETNAVTSTGNAVPKSEHKMAMNVYSTNATVPEHKITGKNPLVENETTEKIASTGHTTTPDHTTIEKTPSTGHTTTPDRKTTEKTPSTEHATTPDHETTEKTPSTEHAITPDHKTTEKTHSTVHATTSEHKTSDKIPSTEPIITTTENPNHNNEVSSWSTWYFLSGVFLGFILSVAGFFGYKYLYLRNYPYQSL